MRKTLLLSAAALAFAAPAAFAPAAFAQTATGPSVAAPAPMPPPSQTPAETTAPGGTMPGTTAAGTAMPAKKPMMHAMTRPMKPATDADIRPGHVPGVGDSFPASNQASNITPGDTRSPIAPRLPTPVGGENAPIKELLTDAQRALDSHQSGRAQEALERAETAMLQRAVPADQASTPDQGPGVKELTAARDALAHHDVAGAKRALAAAMAAT
jgi:hypothetical protein